MRILVTAGPTREPIDPVRFISNRSSGRMGYAVAEAALARGFEVILISGPVCLAPPAGAEVVPVGTAEEMLVAAKSRLVGCDVLVMCAAVADWRPAQYSPVKLKKDRTRLSLELERTPDILGTVAEGKGKRIHVGFAAETGDPTSEALRKLREKGLDLIVANDVSAPDAGFEVETNRAALIDREARVEQLPLMSKRELADIILDRVVAIRDATAHAGRAGG
jgi:phosphopantothenoylcysteine decarboxylase/phosphopantothenate--cysteine ligase